MDNRLMIINLKDISITMILKCIKFISVFKNIHLMIYSKIRDSNFQTDVSISTENSLNSTKTFLRILK